MALADAQKALSIKPKEPNYQKHVKSVLDRKANSKKVPFFLRGCSAGK